MNENTTKEITIESFKELVDLIEISDFNFNIDETKVKSSIKDYIEDNNKLNVFSGFKWSDETMAKIKKYNFICNILYILIAIINVVIILSLKNDLIALFSSSKLFYNFHPRENIIDFIIILVLALLIGYSVSFFLSMILDNNYFLIKKNFINDKEIMLKEIDKLSIVEFINKWLDYHYMDGIDTCLYSYVMQENVKNILNTQSIFKIKASTKVKRFHIFYSLENGTIKDEEFRYQKIVLNNKIKEPYIEFNNEGVYLVTPVNNIL